MTAPIQLGSIEILDLTMQNNSGADIPAGTAVLFDTANPPSGSVPPGCVVPSSGGGVVGTAGITVTTIKAGGSGLVRVEGTYPGTADGSITVGNYVQASDTAAKMGRIKLKGGGLEQLGQALTSATDGQFVLVLLAKAATA